MKRIPSLYVLFILAALTIALAACGRSVATSTSTPIPTPSPTLIPAGTAVIHVKTTSDWTKFRLVSGGVWSNSTLLSSSPEATSANIEGNLIRLEQPLARAEAGKEVELILEVFFSGLDPSSQVVFYIERGHIGWTRVEISTYTGGQPALLKTFTWDKINPDNGNILEVQIPAAELLAPRTVADSQAPTKSVTPVLPTSTSLPKSNVFGTADIIFHNGAIITIEKSQPIAEAIAIKDELILAVGTNEEILALQGPDTTVIDLQGHTLMPGFIDGHTHLLAFPDRMGRTMDQAQEIALRYGLTTVNEMWADEAFLNRLFQAEQQGMLHLRVNVFASYNDGILDQNRQKVILKTWYPENDPILAPQRRVRIPGIKIFVDGDNFRPARGCWAFNDPLPSSAWAIQNGVCGTAAGDLYWQQDELNAAVLQAQKAGYRVAFHAMGEAAIETALNAIEYALNGRPNDQVRHQIEHNSMIRPDLLTRYEALDVLASVRGYGDFCDLKQFIPDFGPERNNWYANRYALPGLDIHSYVESDFGWTIDPEDRYDQRSLDPIMQLYGLVTHNLEGPNGTMCRPDPVVAKFVISVEKALEMMTIEPAYAVSMENYIGSLKPGKYADLIILSDSPLTVDPDALKNLRVWMTMVGGKVEYCATGKEAFCQ